MIQKVVFPSFRENEYSQYDMRQLVSALELRFQSLESNVEGFFPTSADADFDDRYAAAVHTHLVADIIDFDANVPSSIFDLDDVTGTASVGQGLVWNGAEFVAGPLGGSTSLNDLLDVNAPSPSDGEALVWDVSTLRWVPGTASGGGGDSLFGLTDTDLAGQLQGDLLFNANGTEWQSTGWKFQWVDDQYLQFGNGIGINWYDAAFSTVELLSFAGVAASPTATAWAPLADYVSDGEANTVFSTNSSLSIRFNNDGTKVTVCRDTGGTGQDIRVNSPAWSVGYQNEDETAPVRIYEGANFFDQMRDTCWNDDGTKLFLLRGIGGVDGLANAGTPFNPVSGDLSIAETLAVAGGATANAIDFKPDGTTFWIGSSASGGSGGVLQYDMSTPWDVSTGVLGVSYVPTEAIISRGLRFDPSGRKFWVMDNVDNIREYSMTVDWDITSAVYVSVVDFSAYVPAGAINNDGAWGFDVSPDGTVLAVFFFDAGTGSDCQIARFTSDGGEFNAPITEAFTVGDPAYKTQIDGTAICIEGSVGINWDDTEFLALDAAVGISSEWGSNLNTDWSSAGVVAATAALESTGILQDSSFGMDGFDVSDDGLHAIMCEQSGDRIVAYDLDSPYDFENATRTGAIHSGSGAFNPGDSLQWINDGASYMIVDLGGIVRIYNCPSPYVIDGPVGEAQSVSGATLGWSSGTTGFYMSRDGTKLVGSGNNGDSTYSVKIFELATPFVITTGRTLLSTYTYTGDTNAPNGSMSQTQLSADGLTLIFSYSTAEMKLGTMTVPFDVTTMTFSVNRNIQTDMTGNPWQVGHITPDGNSLYVYTDNATQGRVGKYTKDVLNPALQDSTFVVGDPTTATRIDGTATNITSVATDIDGTLNVDGLATFQADVTISDDLTITSGAPKIFMQDSDATADEGNWIIANTTDQFRIETATDVAPETPVEAAITIERTGTTVDSVEMPRVIAGDPGTESSGIIVNGGTYQSVIKASDIGGTNAAQFIIHRHSTTLPAAIVGSRSKDDTSAHTIVADNDVLFGLYAAGWDGVDSYSLSSAIEFEIDGTPGQNDMPGQITFFTSADGTELLVERMRIRSTGDVEIDNDLTVAGDFTVSGTLTSINTSDLNVADNIIILNSGETGAPTLDAGIEIERGTSDNVLFRWNETSDVWEFTNDGTTYFPVVTEHTGEVTGSTALTLDVTAVTNRTDVVAEAADDVAIHDDTDGTLKKVNLSSITDGGFF